MTLIVAVTALGLLTMAGGSAAASPVEDPSTTDSVTVPNTAFSSDCEDYTQPACM